MLDISSFYRGIAMWSVLEKSPSVFLPRLGSRVRIPSPAPDFRKEIKSLRGAFRGASCISGIAPRAPRNHTATSGIRATTGRRAARDLSGSGQEPRPSVASPPGMRRAGTGCLSATYGASPPACRPIDGPLPPRPQAGRYGWQARSGIPKTGRRFEKIRLAPADCRARGPGRAPPASDRRRRRRSSAARLRSPQGWPGGHPPCPPRGRRPSSSPRRR